MKIILSRKGFDSTYGGIASPIFPDNELLSFPIPSKDESTSYSELSFRNMTLDKMISQLSKSGKINSGKKWRNITPDMKCHLDPDLCESLKPRPKGWRPLFGQGEQSQSHLDNNHVGRDDLFLFFGWFRYVAKDENGYSFLKNAPDLHVIYGYLQVSHVVRSSSDLEDWMKDHPHYNSILNNNSNEAIFVSRKKLSFNNQLSGAGCLPLNKARILTMQNYSRSRWALPRYLINTNITYHSKKSWDNDKYFQSARIGQEFIFQETDEAQRWAKEILSRK